MIDWVNLHCHSDGSHLDGMSRVSEIVDYAKKHSGIACITDHRTCINLGNLVNLCVKEDIKPICGCEFNIAETTMDAHDNRGYHICLYAMNKIGFKNMCVLTMLANRDGFYYVPRIDFNTLKQYSEGLICSSGCIGSPFANDIKNGNSPYERLLDYAMVFKDRFFVEYQNHHFKEENDIMTDICSYAKIIGLPVIGTVDSHYTYESDAEIHKVLLAMNMNKPFVEIDGFKGDGYHLLNDYEIRVRFTDEEISNTKVLADMVETDVIDFITDKSPKI